MNNDPQNQVNQDSGQAQQVQDHNVPVSVPVGGSEGSPAVVEKSPQRVENFVQSSEPEPQVSDEVSEYVQPTSRPKIKADAVEAGVTESIPPGPNYANLPTDQVVVENMLKTGDAGSSNTWRALLALKEFAKGLFSPRNPQEAN